LKAPVKSCVPAIANTKKKKKSTSIESLSKGIALISEDTMTLKPATDEMVLRGLITLKDLRALRLTPEPARNIDI
jgi:hypothetical protein